MQNSRPRTLALTFGTLLVASSCAVDLSNVAFDDDRFAELSDGGGGDGGEDGVTPCVHGAPGCDGNQPQVCASGQWFPEGPPCDFACVNGACTGSCVPDSTQCVSTTEVETCDALGRWSETEACAFACLGDDCGGACMPGERSCDAGGNVTVCGDDGSPTVEVTCGGGGCEDALCLFCEDGDIACISPTEYKVCQGGGYGSSPTTSCVNQACSVVGEPCIGVCSPGATACKDGSSRRVVTCDNKGQYTGAEFDCDYVCSGGRCTGECVPGQYRCSGAAIEKCGADGYFALERDCGLSGESCNQVGEVPTCGGCENGTARCAAAGGREVCSMSGGWTVESCGETSGCYNGKCEKYGTLCGNNPFASGCTDNGDVWMCQGGTALFTACFNGACSNGLCEGGGPSPI